MEATLLSSQRFHPQLFPSKIRGALSDCDTRICCPPLVRTKTNCVSFKTNPAQLCRTNSIFLTRPFFSKVNTRVSAKFSNQFQNHYMDVEDAASESLNLEVTPRRPNDGTDVLTPHDSGNSSAVEAKPISSVINNVVESFFKSEIRRRLFVTAALIVVSRVGYFIPLPGFDRRLIPQDYLSFVSGSVGWAAAYAASYLVPSLAPSSFKRDFRYSSKIVPMRLSFKYKTKPQNIDHSSQTGSCGSLVHSTPDGDDFIWFQCRHVIKGLAFNTEPEGE